MDAFCVVTLTSETIMYAVWPQYSPLCSL